MLVFREKPQKMAHVVTFSNVFHFQTFKVGFTNKSCARSLSKYLLTSVGKNFTNCQIESTAFTAEPPTEFVYNFLTQTQTDRTRVDRIKISMRISCGPTVSGEGEKGGEEKL